MGKLRVLSGRDVCNILAQHGFVQARRHGDHVIMQQRLGGSTRTVPVPDHRTLRVGTLLSINRQSGLSRSLFESE